MPRELGKGGGLRTVLSEVGRVLAEEQEFGLLDDTAEISNESPALDR